MSERQAMHVLLSSEANQGLREFANTHGISLSALLESLGRTLVGPAPSGTNPADVRDCIVEKARAIDATRRTRSRPVVDAVS